jgi:hypothetical protein
MCFTVEIHLQELGKAERSIGRREMQWDMALLIRGHAADIAFYSLQRRN